MNLQFFKFYHVFLILLIAVTGSNCASTKILDLSGGASTSYTIKNKYYYHSTNRGLVDTGIWFLEINGDSRIKEKVTPKSLDELIKVLPRDDQIKLNALETNTFKIVFAEHYTPMSIGGVAAGAFLGSFRRVTGLMEVEIMPLKKYNESYKIEKLYEVKLEMKVDQSKKKIFCNLIIYTGSWLTGVRTKSYIVGSCDL